MIVRIKGTLIHKSIDCVVVDVNGIGYRVFVPLTTFYDLPGTGQPVILNTHTYFGKDSISLFGFYTEMEKEVFQLMILVSGIGPKLAMNILSGSSATELIKAVSAGNINKLVGIPGVGRKMAERLILELRDKVAKLKEGRGESEVCARETLEEQIRKDAMSALMNLGYQRSAVDKVLNKIMGESPEKLTLEVVLKKALRILF